MELKDFDDDFKDGLKSFVRALAQSAHVADAVAVWGEIEASKSPNVMFHGPTALKPRKLRLATTFEVEGQEVEIECVWKSGPISEALSLTAKKARHDLVFGNEENENARSTSTT